MRWKGPATHRPDDGAASTSETSVNFYQTTRRNTPEDRNLNTLLFPTTSLVIWETSKWLTTIQRVETITEPTHS
jgi:hypothetical protein